jgi:3-oxoacyl-[acyl-carrier protein] reductase
MSAKDGMLAEKVAVVTGAGTGLGMAYARALSQAGAAVMVADILDSKAEEVAASIRAVGGRAVHAHLDQTDVASVAEMAIKTERELGPPQILINNASLFSALQRKPALEISPEEWEKVLGVNLIGPFNCCRALLPGMIERRYGKIVNISSSSIFSARNNLAHYVAAKAGVIGLTRALAWEYGDQGVTVNAISPGSTDNGVAENREYLQSRVGNRAIKRVQVPDDLIGAVIFLSSPMSDFITGQNLVVDGGGAFQ